MVSSMCWNETCNMLATMQDGKFVVWCYPAVIHSDKDLLPLTKVVKEGRSGLSQHVLKFIFQACCVHNLYS